MKHSVWTRTAYFGATGILGTAAMLLEKQALTRGYDSRGLFRWDTPANFALLAVAVVYALGLIGLTLWRVREDGSSEKLFPRCWFRGSLMTLGGTMLALDLVYALEPQPKLLMLLGFAAAGCILVTGISAVVGHKPGPVFHAVVCVFLLVRLLVRYRSWGYSAHLERYCFPMVAGVLLMLYAFHRTCADAGMVRIRRLVLSGFGAVFCSMIAMADPADWIFYLAATIWVVGSMCDLDAIPMPSQKKKP